MNGNTNSLTVWFTPAMFVRVAVRRIERPADTVLVLMVTVKFQEPLVPDITDMRRGSEQYKMNTPLVPPATVQVPVERPEALLPVPVYVVGQLVARLLPYVCRETSKFVRRAGQERDRFDVFFLPRRSTAAPAAGCP